MFPDVNFLWKNKNKKKNSAFIIKGKTNREIPFSKFLFSSISFPSPPPPNSNFHFSILSFQNLSFRFPIFKISFLLLQPVSQFSSIFSFRRVGGMSESDVSVNLRLSATSLSASLSRPERACVCVCALAEAGSQRSWSRAGGAGAVSRRNDLAVAHACDLPSLNFHSQNPTSLFGLSLSSEF